MDAPLVKWKRLCTGDFAIYLDDIEPATRDLKEVQDGLQLPLVHGGGLKQHCYDWEK